MEYIITTEQLTKKYKNLFLSTMFRFTFGKAAFTVSLAPTVRENPLP